MIKKINGVDVLIEPGANLQGADLRWANLQGADLRWADLREANLRYVDLRDANLRWADLREANLRYVDLRDADLREANLIGANLSYADLRDADLRDADLRDADLPAPPMVLMAGWGNVSDHLCARLMKYDEINCPNGPELFQVWASGGTCPYSLSRVQRSANFRESRELYDPDAPLLSALELMILLICECCSDSDYHAT